MNKTTAIIFHNGIACIVIIMALLLCREANIDERYETQHKVAEAVEVEKKAIQDAKVKALRAGLANVQKLHTCSKDAHTFGLETDFVVVAGVDNIGPRYFNDSLYAITMEDALNMKPDTVWNLLYCMN